MCVSVVFYVCVCDMCTCTDIHVFQHRLTVVIMHMWRSEDTLELLCLLSISFESGNLQEFCLRSPSYRDTGIAGVHCPLTLHGPWGFQLPSSHFILYTTKSSPQSYRSYSLCLLANLVCLKRMETFLAAVLSTLKVLVLPTRFILTLCVFSVVVWSFNGQKQQEGKAQRRKNFG